MSKSQPCKIDELIRLLHPKDNHSKIIAMVEAYFDESGIHQGARVCIIAGYFGRHNAWARLENEWRNVLSDHSLPLEKFHAKDIVKAHRHQEMLKQLVACIAKRDLFPISAGVVIDDFKQLAESERKWFTGGSGKSKKSGAASKPYFLPFQMCVRQVTHYTPAGSKAHFFFGVDRPFAEYATALFAQIKASAYSPEWEEKRRLGDVAFPQAKETPELQAADLFAHLSYLHWIGRGSDTNWNAKPNGLLATCLKRTKSKYDHVYLNKRAFEQTFEKALEMQRQRDKKRSIL